MDFLLDNPIAWLEGTAFIVLFIVYCISIIAVLAVAKSNLDNTDKLPIPAIPPEVDPYEVAYLRGGANELARSVIFSLMQKGFVAIVNDGKTGRIRTVENVDRSGSLTEVERTALAWVGFEREAKDVFDSRSGLVEQMELQSARYQIELANRQFLTPDDLTARAKKYAWTAAALIAGLGGYKVFASVMAGRFNIIFTIVITVIAFVVAMTVGRLPRATKLGKQYLERLRLAFEGLIYTSQKPYIGANAQRPALAESGHAGIDPLLISVGVFGTGILAGTMFAGYNDAFARAQKESGSGGGGCGSSCGSGSSCSSGCGSGCGGGGCGGGGCG